MLVKDIVDGPMKPLGPVKFESKNAALLGASPLV